MNSWKFQSNIIPAFYLLVIVIVSSNAFANTSSKQQFDAFDDAWKAAKQGDKTAFIKARKIADGYIIDAYLDFAWLSHHLDVKRPKAVRYFLQTHPDLPASKQLRSQWLTLLGKKRQWKMFLDDYKGNGNERLQCYNLTARLKTGQTKGLLDQAQKLWQTGKSLPSSCNTLFFWMMKKHRPDSDTAWLRVQKALPRGEKKLLLYLTRFLDRSAKKALNLWLEIRKHPERVLRRNSNWSDTPRAREILKDGIWKLAAYEPEKANKYWLRLGDKLSYSQKERASIHRRIALMGATEFLPIAKLWLDQLTIQEKTNNTRAWQVRMALHDLDWKQVQKLVQSMPASQRNKARWQYWLARSLNEQNQRSQAEEIWKALTLEPGYHAFMAADQLFLPYTICPQARNINPTLINNVRQHTGIVRALELQKHQLNLHARREWFSTLTGLDNSVQRTAAILASQQGWHDVAIKTLADIKDWRLYSIRYPLEWRKLLSQETHKHHVDLAWSYAIIRAESAFAADAISSANARGLMQLMPHVAKQLARKHGKTINISIDLLKPARNIPLGVEHLHDYTRKHHNKIIEATAAYNAGPNAVKRWNDKVTVALPADVWIETLTYGDTRNYVQQVLAFMVMYDWRLSGQLRRVSDIISGQSSLHVPICPAGAQP